LPEFNSGNLVVEIDCRRLVIGDLFPEVDRRRLIGEKAALRFKRLFLPNAVYDAAYDTRDGSGG
jgi:hypothetical protein